MFGDPQSFFNSIAEKSHLKEGRRGVERIVIEIFRRQNQKTTNKELSRNVRIPVPVLSAVRGELLKAGFLESKSLLSTVAIEWIEKNLGLSYSFEFLRDFIMDSTFSVSKKYMEQAENPRILGLTASPGSSREKIDEVCKNLAIDCGDKNRTR